MAGEKHGSGGDGSGEGPRRVDPPALEVRTNREDFDKLVRNLQTVFAGKTKLDLLLISGGGSRGAWGAGFLNGWSQATAAVTSPNPGPDRPQFDVVTGVSTGAVQAPAAFMGSAYDHLLEEGYTTVENDMVYGWSPLPFPRNLDALKDTLVRFYPDDFWQAVAAETPSRRLFVGTVNIETADFVSWDLTRLAEQGDYELCRTAIRASSANPAGIWPVMIDEEQHVDGGVRYRLYVDTIFRSMVEASNLANVPGVKRVYYLVNGRLAYETKQIWSWNFPGILDRALEIALDEGLFGSLYGTWYHMNKTGIEWDFNGVSIPLGIPLPDPGEYDPAEMEPLYQIGVQAGRDNVWDVGLPEPGFDLVRPPI